MQINRILLGNNYDAAIILKFHTKQDIRRLKSWGAEKERKELEKEEKKKNRVAFAFLYRVRKPPICIAYGRTSTGDESNCVQMHFKRRNGKNENEGKNTHKIIMDNVSSVHGTVGAVNELMNSILFACIPYDTRNFLSFLFFCAAFVWIYWHNTCRTIRRDHPHLHTHTHTQT